LIAGLLVTLGDLVGYWGLVNAIKGTIGLINLVFQKLTVRLYLTLFPLQAEIGLVLASLDLFGMGVLVE
jgi:hypothetical protein